MATEQITIVLLYFSVAGICKVDVLPVVLAVIFVDSSSNNVNPTTVQTGCPPPVPQLKVAADPSVALTDVGVMMKAEI